MSIKTSNIAASIGLVHLALAEAAPKPLVVFTGVYGAYQESKPRPETEKDKRLKVLVYRTFKRWSTADSLPFALLLETDAEGLKRMASDPVSMALVLTRDDIQSEVFATPCCGDFRRSLANAGLSILFYQTRLEGKVKVNTVIASIPLNGYISRLSQDRAAPSGAMADDEFLATVQGLLDGPLRARMEHLGLETKDMQARKDPSGKWRLEGAQAAGIEVGQTVRLWSKGKPLGAARMVSLDGGLEFAHDSTRSQAAAAAKLEAKVANLRGFSDETYQVVASAIESKKASRIFGDSHLSEQMAQWFSDYLAEHGKAVLPPLVGSGWVVGSSGQMEVVLSRAGGDRETFAMAPARHPLTIALTGVGSAVVDSNQVNSIWAYKVWISVADGKTGKEFEFTTPKKTVNGMQSFEERDVFRDLVHKSMSDLSVQGVWR